MSANSTFPPTTDRESAGIDLTLALVSLGQALRVVTLAHAGTSGARPKASATTRTTEPRAASHRRTLRMRSNSLVRIAERS